MAYGLFRIRETLQCKFKVEDEQLEAIATIILRVPGYFILDYWYQNDVYNCIPRSLAWPDVVSSGFAIVAVIQGILVLLLPLEQLVALYMHYLTVAVLAAADKFSRYYIAREKELVIEWPDYGTFTFQGFSNMLILQKSLFDPHNDTETLYLRQQVSAIVFHILVATFVTFFLDIEGNKDKILLLVYLVPVFARLSGFPLSELQATHNFASCFVVFLTVQYIFLCLPRVLLFVRGVYQLVGENLEMFGPIGLVTSICRKVFVPVQLLIFWLMLYVTQVYNHYLHVNFDAGSVGTNKVGVARGAIPEFRWLLLVQSAAEVCYTPLMLMGCCVTVSYLSYGFLSATRAYISGSARALGPMPDDLAHSGWTEGATMALLSVQTSLLSMGMPERLAVLSIILLVVISSLVQSMYELVEPVVMALSAQGIASLGQHLRAVSACLTLLCLPLYMVYTFTLIFEKDFWLLLILSTSVMTSVQALGLMATYGLLTWDALSPKPWPGLDDVIYYTRASTRVLEFAVAVLVVAAGLEESITGRWSWVNAAVLLVHCYVNVWQRMTQGWRSFLLRLEAAKKISALPLATPEELARYNDVCAICYADLACRGSAARVTECHHVFHSACLRKWLYVQDVCPMCYASISLVSQTEEKLNADAGVENDAPPAGFIEDELGNNIPFDEDDDSYSSVDEDDSESS